MLFALFAAQAFAFDVRIMVTVSQGTAAVGANITVVKDGVLLYNARAGADGSAAFKLDAGSYFIYLDRGGYPRHVNLLEVAGNQNVTYTMRQTISYAGAYGQMYGPADFSNASVAAYVNGNVAKRTGANKDGYYQMSFLPEGQYELVFSAPGFVDKREAASLLMSQFSEVDARLDKVSAAAPQPTTMSAPKTAQRQSLIEISLMNGSMPFAGQAVNVDTPAGNVVATTGADGRAHVNAVVPGMYVFTYGNLTAVTVVAGDTNATPAQPQPAEPEPAAPTEPQPQQQANGGLAAGAVVIAIICIIVVLGIALFVVGRMKKAKQGPNEPAHSEEAHHKHAGAKHDHAHRHKK